MRAFIIRPFGVKNGIDFDKVEAELIGPALDRLHIDGRTTGDVVEAGNIREDMFQMLLVSDLVVADISIDNPNAYYELGIRHALKEKRTFLIRAQGMTNDVPFDLRTDRYLAYDAAAPGGTLERLYEGLKATLASERQDSPVFRVLPELREQDRSKFLPVPREFREEVEYAVKAKLRGKLALLGQEARGSLWESAGLRMVEREQFQTKAFEGARTTLEDPISVVTRTILFTGHQIDSPHRKNPRFPADKESIAREAIRTAVLRELDRYGNAIGIAGAASGGDILFHEVCVEVGIPTKIFLALPPDTYVAESVAPAGPDWVRRFRALHSRFPAAPILAGTKELPGWLRHLRGYTIWQRYNLWMLNEALTAGAQRVTLIALWNGEQGDGPGGSADMIKIASKRGAETRVLDSKALFGL